jgi:transposase
MGRKPCPHYLRRRDIRYTIPRKDNELHRGMFDKSLYRQRNWVERCFIGFCLAIGVWLKQFRRTATRYEKKVQSYFAMLTIVTLGNTDDRKPVSELLKEMFGNVFGGRSHL